MIRVWGCLTQAHNPWLVVLALLICIFACVTAMTMLWRTSVSVGRHRLFWLISAGAIAGFGVWATHFVAMLAFTPGLPMAYDGALTAVSILIAVVLCAAGFALALKPGYAVAGGALTGAAISAMHYVGMAALRAPATLIWDYAYVAASVLIGIALSAVAMWVQIQNHSLRRMALAAALFTVAICGMHFTGMTALTLVPNPVVDIPDAVLYPESLAWVIAASAILVVTLGLVGGLLDDHLARRTASEAENMRKHIQQLETTSRNLNLALRAADAANRSKSQFIAVMSHELRTPLNAVLGFSQMILSEPFGALGSPRYRDYIQDISDSGAHLLQLVNRVLEISRFDTGAIKLEELDLNISAIIGELLRGMMPKAKAAQVRLVADIETGLPLLRADMNHIAQILTLLVENAVKFTPAGGSVRIGAKRRDGGLALFIADTGIGIAAKDMAKALDRFGQVDDSFTRRYEGAGLGLPLAKLLTELHGGRLSIESEQDVGTTVTVYLPGSRLISEGQAA
jgi:signal transduction histidine kinase